MSKTAPPQTDIAFFRAIHHMDTAHTVPEKIGDVGAWQTDLDRLIEALENDGDSGYNTAKAALSNGNKDFRIHYATLPPEALQEDTDPRFTPNKNGKPIFVTLSEDDIDALPDIEYMLSGILLTSSVSMLYGESNTGKTFTALDIAEHIARGLMWLARRVKQCKVLYIYGEGGRGMKPRLQAWRKHHNDSPTTSNIRFIGAPVHLITDRQALLDTIAASQEETPYKYIVIDPYSIATTGTNQNDQMEVTKTLMTAHEIVRNYDAHVMIVHHTNKSGGFNGTAAFKNHVDTMIELKRESEDMPTSPIIMRCEKQRDGQYFPDIKLQLEVVELGIHPHTYEPITSCVLVGNDTPTRKEAQTEMQLQAEEQEQKIMLDILSGRSRMTTNAWKKDSKESGVSGRAFEKHYKVLEASHKIASQSSGKVGAPIYWTLCREELL